MIDSNARRLVCHFSCGTSSAVATKIALARYREKLETVVLRIRIENEHPDNDRFSDDVARWIDHPITTIQSTKYTGTWDVYERERFLIGPHGARCTTELKKLPGRAFWKDGDVDVFGYGVREKRRAKRLRENNPELTVLTPLIDAELDKPDCHALIQRAGIRLPAMYEMGFRNNNCIGCVKGGAGYWNKIRIHFPDVFSRMAALERDLDVSILRSDGNRVFLDELPIDSGRIEDEADIECGLFCHASEELIND